MHLTTDQQTTLRNAILADPVLSILPQGNGSALQIANAFNVIEVPDYKAWKSGLGLHDYTEQPDVDSTSAVTAFAGGGGTGSLIDRSVGERDVFIRVLWNSVLVTKPYLPNVRIMLFDIFSGTNALSVMNRKHFWARGQRAITRLEKALAIATVGGPRHDANNGNSPAGQTGARGSWTNPDTLTAEESVDYHEINLVMGWAE